MFSKKYQARKVIDASRRVVRNTARDEDHSIRYAYLNLVDAILLNMNSPFEYTVIQRKLIRPKTSFMKKGDSIIFDFDGVIADSLSIAFEVNKLSKPTLTLERYQAAFDGNINDAKYEDKVVRKIDFNKEYGERFATLGIDAEKKKFIQKLAKEFQLYIVSSTDGKIIREYLCRHQILDCFIAILGNEIHTSKVKKFRMLFDQYNIDPKNVIFIADTLGDLKEAKEAGIASIIGILGGYQKEESVEKAKPTMIVDNLSQFYNAVHPEINLG